MECWTALLHTYWHQALTNTPTLWIYLFFIKIFTNFYTWHAENLTWNVRLKTVAWSIFWYLVFCAAHMLLIAIQLYMTIEFEEHETQIMTTLWNQRHFDALEENAEYCKTLGVMIGDSSNIILVKTIFPSAFLFEMNNCLKLYKFYTFCELTLLLWSF